MQQIFRRQLLALRELGDTPARVGVQCRQFIGAVLAARIELRPNTEAVRDVLLADGVPPAAATQFTETFDRAVWARA